MERPISNFEFVTAHKIINEIHGVKNLADICTRSGIHSPLIVTDKGIVSAGLLPQVSTPLELKQHCFSVFDQVIADPPFEIVEDAIAFAQQQGCDGVIGFGGGSSLDVAKLVAVLVDSNQQLKDILGIDNIVGARLPLILIPTTAGTGSEVTPVAIVTTGETTKAGIVSSILLPDIAILDAALTLNLPAHVTAATGIDAMVHAIEAYTSKIKKNPYSDMLAKQALALLSANIVQATFEPSNLNARQNMLLGACLAGQAFANAPVAAVHALAYPLGGHFHIPHGLSNALVLTQVMRFNLSHAADLYAELADVFVGLELTDSECDQDSTSEYKALWLIDCLAMLSKKLGLQTRLRDLSIAQSDLETLADDAMLQTRLLINNPKPLSRDDALSIYASAW